MMMLVALFSLGLCVLVKNNYCRVNLSVLLFRQVIIIIILMLICVSGL